MNTTPTPTPEPPTPCHRWARAEPTARWDDVSRRAMTAAAELADDELAEALAAIQAEREYLTRLSDEWNALQRHAEQMRDDYTAHTDDTNEARARAVAATYREVAALMEDATWRAMRRPSPRPTPRN